VSDQLVRFSCSSCGTVYQLSRDRIGPAGRKVRCAVCEHKFIVKFTARSVPPVPPAEQPAAGGQFTDPFDVPPAESVTIDGLEELAEKTLRMSLDELAGQEPGLAASEGKQPLAAVESLDETLQRDADTIAQAVEEAKKAAREQATASEIAAPAPRAAARAPGPADAEMPEPKLPPIEMPDKPTEETPLSLQTLRSRWGESILPERRRSSFFGGPEVAASSGLLYKLIIPVVGAAALTAYVFNIGQFGIDPLWAVIIIVLGVLSFQLQCLSGLLVTGLFSFFYPLALFSTQRDAISSGDLGGVFPLSIEAGFAVTILVIYFVLMSRKGGLFVLKEGTAQSMGSFAFAVVTTILVVWANVQSASLPQLGQFAPMGTPLDSARFYIDAGLPSLLQAAALSLAIAFGFSARALRNRMLFLANLGLAIGFMALLLFYVQLVIGRIPVIIPL